MYVIAVDWRVAEEMAERFHRRLLTQAEASLIAEPHCHRFDICRHETEAGRFLLYEIYTDRAAFEAHLKTPHFAAFDAEVKAMTLSKSASAWTL